MTDAELDDLLSILDYGAKHLGEPNGKAAAAIRSLRAERDEARFLKDCAETALLKAETRFVAAEAALAEARGALAAWEWMRLSDEGYSEDEIDERILKDTLIARIDAILGTEDAR